MKLRTLIALLWLLGSGNSVLAEEIEVWHGWMNLTPCTKVEWDNSGFLGLPSPTYREGPQELHGWIYAEVATAQDLTNQVRNDCIQCGIRAGAVAAAAAILTEGAGGWPAFTAAFWDCLSTRAETYSVITRVRLATDTRCNW